MRRSSALASVFAVVLSGCATHPLPEDVTRETTFEIVQKIRCEARDALDRLTVAELRKSHQPATLRFADQIESGELRAIDVFNSKMKYFRSLDRSVLPKFQTYTLSAVTFDFAFTITEDNNNLANANFRLPTLDGVFTLNTNGGARFNRQTLRKFQVVNSFYELHTLPRADCLKIEAKIANVIYPITGRIGVEEVFRTFVDIDDGGGLVATSTQKFSDSLTFLTALNASVNPKIMLTPISARQFRLAEAAATLSALRTDEHKVTLAIAKGTLVTSFEQARASAKVQSKVIADDVRTEDFFIQQRNNTRRLDELLR